MASPHWWVAYVAMCPVMRPARLGALACLTLQRWCARWGPAMLGRLLVGIGEFEQCAIVVGASQKGNPGREMIAREPCRYHDRRDKYYECVEMWSAFLIDKGRGNPIDDTRWLVLDGFMHDGVQAMISHDFEHAGQQCVTRLEI